MVTQTRGPSRRELRERRTRRAGRRQHRGHFRQRSYQVVVVLLAPAVALSTYAYLTAHRAAGQIGAAAHPQAVELGIEARDVLRHAVLVSALALAVLVHSAQLRAAHRHRAAAVVPWLVVTVPLAVEVTANVALYLTGPVVDLVPVSAAMWGLAALPGWVGVVGLLAADGSRSTWTAWTLPAAACALAAVAAIAAARPDLAEPLRGWELGPLRAVVVGMILTAALVASSALPTLSRWTRAIGCSVPAAALALMPTLVTYSDSMVATQRWTVVLYPLAAVAGACLAVLFVGCDQVIGRRRSATNDVY
jgi:hypothetical protein